MTKHPTLPGLDGTDGRQLRAAALCLSVAVSLLGAPALAADPPAAAGTAMPKKATADIEATSASNPREVSNKVREALGHSILPNKKLTLVINEKPPGASKPGIVADTHAKPPTAAHSTVPAMSQTSRQYIQARARALAGHAPEPTRSAAAVANTHAAPHAGEAHWSYEGAAGPQAWGQLKPEFNVCAIGKRQSPINIDDSNTLQGPAEPLQFSYTPSNASVVNNGHTIQVDVQGDNLLTVRGSRYRLLQFHFHTPSEEQINFKRSVMVAHLVHKNDEGQLAVVAVLMEPGTTNPLIDKVWTYMPLDTGDRVRMPPEMLNVSELLPKDQRYYQFMGSLTTPPCTEGVLWMVMKQAVPISKSQYRLFTQLYPNNARPIQPANGRPIRDAL